MASPEHATALMDNNTQCTVSRLAERQSWQSYTYVYVSTVPARRAFSASLALATPLDFVDVDPQDSHGALFTQLKKSRLNQSNNALTSASCLPASDSARSSASSFNYCSIHARESKQP